MVEIIYRTDDGKEFGNAVEARAHEAITRNRRHLVSSLNRMGFDGNSAEVIVERALPIHRLLQSVLGTVTVEGDDD